MRAPDTTFSDIDALPESRSLRAAAAAARARQRTVHARLALAAVAVPFLLVAVAIAWEPATPVAVLYGVAFYMAWTLRLGKVESAPAREAARWREALDCESLDLQWNRALAGERRTAPERTPPPPASGEPPVAEARPYPDLADSVPLAHGRLLCQLAALDWDRDAARRYRATLSATVGGVALLLLAGMVVRRPETETVLVGLFALSPVGWWLYQVHLAHARAQALCDRIVERVESAWRSSLTGVIKPAALVGLARGIQNDLYAFRAARPALLPWPARRSWPPLPPGERRLEALVAGYRKAATENR